jgi:hypothetical protein
MMKDPDARHLAKNNVANKQGEAQLKAQGDSQAHIDADQRIVKLRQAQTEPKMRADKAADEHALNQARIGSLNARAARDKAKAAGKGGGGGGSGGGDGAAAVTDYLIANPGDVGGARRLAGQMKVPDKVFNSIVTQTKPTEGQTRDAQQSTVGLRALDAIAKAGYTPSRDEIQKWINNQRLVQGAAETGVKGLGLTIGQNLPGPFKVPSSETEGMSDKAQDYFANVRRYIETIGRKQSGAAISPMEWQNFFNQYGPTSKGGLEAARQYLNDQMRSAGVAGRQIGGGGGGGGGGAKSAPDAGTLIRPKTGQYAGKTLRARSDGGYDLVSDGRN